jgi:hypothetical protein
LTHRKTTPPRFAMRLFFKSQLKVSRIGVIVS